MKQIIMPLKCYEDFLYSIAKKPYKCTVVNSLEAEKTYIIPSDTTFEDAEPYIGSEEYEVISLKHKGGTVISFPEEIFMGIVDNQPIESRQFDIVAYLRGKGINARKEGNDLLCDGYKVAGEMVANIGDSGYHYYGLFISINADADVVNKICKKTMEKPPRGLSYYGVTRKEILGVLGLYEE